MRPGARTPEELETLFEDALIVGDAGALVGLFEDGAVLDAGGELQQARGNQEIARVATAMWGGDRTYLADLRRVVQVREIALSVGHGINVLRRGTDGAWRYVISLLDLDNGQQQGR
ncbi:MAG: hypothetical protein ACRD02_00205 [Acidimicrobiia bacterium]